MSWPQPLRDGPGFSLVPSTTCQHLLAQAGAQPRHHLREWHTCTGVSMPHLASELPCDPGAVTDTEPEAGRGPVTCLGSRAVRAGSDLGFFDTRAHNTLESMNNC